MLDKGWREWAQIMAEVKPSLYEASWKKEIEYYLSGGMLQGGPRRKLQYFYERDS